MPACKGGHPRRGAAPEHQRPLQPRRDEFCDGSALPPEQKCAPRCPEASPSANLATMFSSTAGVTADQWSATPTRGE
jgi:hypothetical protein